MLADIGGIATGGDELKAPGFVNMLGHVECEGTMSIGSAEWCECGGGPGCCPCSCGGGGVPGGGICPSDSEGSLWCAMLDI